MKGLFLLTKRRRRKLERQANKCLLEFQSFLWNVTLSFVFKSPYLNWQSFPMFNLLLYVFTFCYLLFVSILIALYLQHTLSEWNM